jgi:hypothetical protein
VIDLERHCRWRSTAVDAREVIALEDLEAKALGQRPSLRALRWHFG